VAAGHDYVQAITALPGADQRGQDVRVERVRLEGFEHLLGVTWYGPKPADHGVELVAGSFRLVEVRQGLRVEG